MQGETVRRIICERKNFRIIIETETGGVEETWMDFLEEFNLMLHGLGYTLKEYSSDGYKVWVGDDE